ncbi:cytochrome c1 [Aspergillus nomiae NRRL 13137]|uniref:quinol--cytochrome-c reductase n=1 Tax=Aspergillus nomiae NRRL (strain ATCC 15546 / NRRL 13137 / CBS 260.88 / M93) TaxID=1509407 RepID=A0A0L1J6K8_ASPN3|nr:cytochrome c1 [Aspergillus nomiae NRRL 13137]KNG87038.1 cytochrome c1 [Aspergillus nomiae NRRL 13137]
MMEVFQQPVLHVEARVKNNGDGIIIRTDLIREEVTKWLVANFVVLSLGQEISSFEGLSDSHAQAIDSVVVTECSGEDMETGAYRLQQVELDVQAYQLRAPLEQESSQHTLPLEESMDSKDEDPKARVLSLPSRELDGLWESLQFDQPLKSMLLRAITRMVSYSSRKLNRWTINWNRLILLWGPPGTGKTSLCRGLTQKLAIRIGKHYPQSKLVEINAHSLGSKFFGESGKLVSKTFENIESLLEEEEDTFVCLIIDEIETLAARRERALGGNEPFDAVRAVNALLTGLDRLKTHANVVVICTSNLVTALDQAFLDRVDIKQFVPYLSNRAIYGIYKECLEELSRCEIIEGASFDVVQVNPDNPQTALQYVEQATEALLLPTFDEMLLNYQMFPESVPKQLGDAALESMRVLNIISMLARTVSRSVPFRGIARQSLNRASTRASSSAAGAESASSPFHLTVTASVATAVAVGSAAYLYGQEAFASTPAEEGLHPTNYPWEHAKWNKTFDHAALRRGFQVYREVCASCHSLTRVPWRSFVGVMHTVDEMKAMAEENEYDTEPNDQGEIEKRPGKLSDYIPAPYKNEEAARAANGGALPPDLSLIVKGRHGGCNYIFSLLTGYPDEPPAGATVQEGMNFNPYFPGTAIAMGRVLFDGVVEYEDGTPATTSQMAKDVVEFLNWAAEPEMDDRKKMGVKAIALLTGLFAVSVWVKRYKWSPIKTRKIVYSPPVSRR